MTLTFDSDGGSTSGALHHGANSLIMLCYNMTAAEEPGKEGAGNIPLDHPKNASWPGKE